MSAKNQVVSSIKWSSFSQFGRQAMQLGTTVILARLLKPADFGLLGMATLVIGFVALFKDLGTSAAVIQRKEISPLFLSSIFWINAVFGLLAAAVLFLLSPIIALFYHEPLVRPLLQVLSVTFLISGLSILQQAILERGMSFDRLAKLELVATLLGSLVGIISALLKCGVWSLVYQTVAITIVTTILLWVFSPWRPSANFRWEEIKSATHFSMNLTGFSIFNYFVRNADYLLIGKFLGAQQLGYYTLAYKIMLYPLQAITSVICRVMFPAFSQMQDDNEQFRRAYLKVTKTIALITFPMMMGLITLAEPFVILLFGEKWRSVSFLLMVLAPVGMVQSIGATVGAIYQAKGRTDWMFRWGLVTGIITVAAFAVGLRWGIIGVAIAYAVVSALVTYPNFVIPFRLIRLPMVDFVTQLWPTVLCSTLMFVSLYCLRSLLIPPAYSTFGLVISSGLIIYLTMSFILNKEQIRQIKEIF